MVLHRLSRASSFTPALRRLAAAVGAAIALMGAASAGQAASTVQFVTYTGGLGDWSPYVADDLGYFKDEGVDFQMHTFQNPGDIATSIISGRADIATSSLPLVIAGVLSGTPIKLISATQEATPRGGYNNWWAALPSAGIAKPADLRGRKIHIYSQNSLAQAVTRRILAGVGIKVGDYQEIALPFPQAYTALESGLTDVSLFIEPFYTRANQLSRGKYGKPLTVIYTYLDAFPNGLDLSGMFANANFLVKNPGAVRAFLRATTRAATWGNAHPDELKKVIAKYAGVPYDDIKDAIPSEMSEDGKFIPGMLDEMQRLMIEYKTIPNLTSPLSEDAFVDLSYLPASR
jgi:ABC-type nitrate/sulfonate/bicarbonate transport system substrate-binding protein